MKTIVNLYFQNSGPQLVEEGRSDRVLEESQSPGKAQQGESSVLLGRIQGEGNWTQVPQRWCLNIGAKGAECNQVVSGQHSQQDQWNDTC